MGKKKDNISDRTKQKLQKGKGRKNSKCAQKIGRVLTYILLYSWIIPVYLGFIFLISVIVESFTCSNFKLTGELCSGLNVLFGYGCTIMCGNAPAFSNAMLDLTVLGLFSALIIFVFAMAVMRLTKIQTFKGSYKLDPVTNFIVEKILKILSRKKQRKKR